MARPKITVIVDGDRVTVKGNTADVQVDVQVIGQRPVMADNTVDKRWFETWWGVTLIGVVVTVLGGGALVLLGWTG